MNNYQQRHSGGRVTKWKGKVASIAPALMLGSVSIIALSSPGVSAPYGDVDITIAANNPITDNPVSTAIIDINVADYTSTLTVDGNLTGVGNGAAIDFQQDLSGTATVNGDISMSGPTTGYGINVRGDVKGTLTNTGAITVDVSGSATSSAYGFGLRANSVSGTMSNSGSVDVIVSNTSGATATGIDIGPIATSGSVVNSGDLFVSASASSYAYANGINLGAVNGTLENSGTVTVGAFSASSSAQAIGIAASSVGTTGRLTNTGSMLVLATGSYTATATGIRVFVDTQGALTNTGTIAVGALAYTSAQAYGIRANNILQGGSLTNSGDILAGASATSGSATAYGILANEVNGSFTNSGDIIVGAGTGSTSSSSATAYGIQVDAVGRISGAGAFSNSGNITLLAGGSNYAYAYGLDIQEIHGTSTVTNTGDITIALTGANGGWATGISTRGLQDSAEFTNSGNITIAGTPSGTTHSRPGIGATGIYLGGQYDYTTRRRISVASGAKASNSGDINLAFVGKASGYASGIGISTSEIHGSFSNSGDISIAVSAESRNASATGLNLSTIGMGGSVDNSGNISITAVSASSSASAEGIYVFFIESGATLKNTGDISISVTSQTSAVSATGIGTGNVFAGGSFTNSGNITMVANAFDSADLNAIDVGNIDGTVTNSGNITLTATATTSSASVTALSIGDIGAAGSFTNSGDVTITASSVSSDVFVEGLYVYQVPGSLENTANISVAANAATSATVKGFVLGSSGSVNSGGSLTNSGDTTIAASSTSSSAYAAGFEVFLGSSGIQSGGTLTNSGNLSISADGQSGTSAYGLRLNTVAGTVNSFGNMSLAANGGAGATGVAATGIHVNDLSGTLNVTGDILVSGNGTNYGIYLGTGSGTLNIDSSANIDSTIRVADHTVKMNHVGEAAVYRFEDANIAPGGGGFTTASSNANWVWVVDAEGTATPTYAAVNTTDFSSGTSTTQLAGAIGDTLGAELAELSTGETTRLDLTASAQRIQGYAGASLLSFQSASADVNMGLIQGGSMMTSQSGNRFGLGLSVINYNGRDGSTALGARGAALSATYLASLGGMDLGFGLSYGAVQTDSARTVGGSPDALASFGSDFATASFSASREFDVGGEGVLTGFGKALVGQQKVDGYTETGSLANATVGAQTVNFHQYSLGAEYRVPQPDGVFTASVEAVRTESSNAGGFQLSVLGSGLTGGATSVSDTYAKVSFGLDQDMANGGLLSLGMATTFFGDTTQQSVSAKYTFDF